MSVTTTWNQQLRALYSDDHIHEHVCRPSRSFEVNKSPLIQEEPTNLQRKLLASAAAVRAKIGSLAPPCADDLSFSSAFVQPDNHQRGFCNWLIPGHLMIGQYPGQNPLPDGPTAEAAAQHLERMTNQGQVSVFCSLQLETPAQDRDDDWREGNCYLQPEAIRRQLPRPFTQYAPLVRQYSVQNPVFLHAPIEDLNVPECQEPLQLLLLELLQEIEQQKVVYVHCWGGRGRAGLVGACLLTLIWPHWKASTILSWVQRGYSTRVGHERLAPEYASSPQTFPQRQYVTAFVEQYQAFEKHQT